jgi:uncharacterized membrane protein
MMRDLLAGAAALIITGAATSASAGYTVQELFAPAGTPAGANVRAMAINDHDLILVNGYDNSPGFSFTVFNDIYNQSMNAFVSLPQPLGADPRSAVAYGINNNGQIVGSYHSSNPLFSAQPWLGYAISPVASSYYGFSAQNVNLGLASYNQPTGINDAGVIVGAAGDLPMLVGYTYQGSVFTPYAAGTSTDATVLTGINNEGIFLGAYGDAASYTYNNAFFSNGVTQTALTPAGWQNVIPGGISNPNDKGDFLIVGGVWDNGGANAAFVFDDATGTYSYFTIPGAIYTFASGVNVRGEVVGEWEDANGLVHAFYALPDGVLAAPEPSAWTLMLLGVGGAGALIRRRRAGPAV